MNSIFYIIKMKIACNYRKINLINVTVNLKFEFKLLLVIKIKKKIYMDVNEIFFIGHNKYGQAGTGE